VENLNGILLGRKNYSKNGNHLTQELSIIGTRTCCYGTVAYLEVVPLFSMTKGQVDSSPSRGFSSGILVSRLPAWAKLTGILEKIR